MVSLLAWASDVPSPSKPRGCGSAFLSMENICLKSMALKASFSVGGLIPEGARISSRDGRESPSAGLSGKSTSIRRIRSISSSLSSKVFTLRPQPGVLQFHLRSSFRLNKRVRFSGYLQGAKRHSWSSTGSALVLQALQIG